VSFTDAEAYAAWLSASTGQHWRLPTLEEWDRAADGLARDHGVQAAADPADPSRLWLAQFDAQSAEEGEADGALRPAGAFGTNAFGVADMDGNVWEWTSTCHSRTRLDATGAAISRVDSCGVRILEGRHRMPMNVFVEDARGGGCSMGVPPDNMGFRLVRDRGWLEQATDWVRSLLA
jgi:formylglycine-generating enzyme required for sulfatase activity